VCPWLHRAAVQVAISTLSLRTSSPAYKVVDLPMARLLDIRPTFEKPPDLVHEAYVLATEIRDGKWEHVQGLKNRPVPACEEIIEELHRRCPGHAIPAYQRAIADGMFASR